MAKKNRAILIGVIGLAVAIAIGCIILIFADLGAGDSKEGGAPVIEGLKFQEKVKLKYANQFSIYKYKGGYAYLEIVDGDKLLVVPKGKKVPKNLDKNVIVVKQPLQNTYLVSTAVMALFDSLDALDNIKFVGTNHWYIENAKRAVEEKKWINAGKYNTPDYEALINGKCELAIQNTMILHNPEVKEKLVDLGIKTMIEKSSYESHPLGRTEWIKFFGVLLDKEELANKVFDEEAAKVEKLENTKSTGKKVIFFYVNTRGNVVTYKSKGYVPEMIKIAGGKYAFSDLGKEEDNKLSTINMSMEEFYNTAKDADILIYNCSIVEQIHTLDELFEKSPVLKDFKAVKEGNAWCTSRSMFQQTNKMGSIIQEMNAIFSGDKEAQKKMEYLFKLK